MSRLAEESPLCSSEEEVELASPGVRRGYRYWIAVPVALSVVLGAALVLGHDRDDQGGSFTIAKVSDAISDSSYVQTKSYKCNMKHEEALSKCEQAGSRRLTKKAASEDCIPYKEHANVAYTGKEDEFDMGAEADWSACHDKCNEMAAADPPCKAWVFQYDGLCYVKYDLGTDPVEFTDEESPDTDAGMMCSEAENIGMLERRLKQGNDSVDATEENATSGAGGDAATNEEATLQKCRSGANKDYMACCASMPKQRCSFPCSETCQQRFGIMTSNYTKCCLRCPGGTCVDPWRLLDEFW